MTDESEELFTDPLRGTVARVVFENPDSGWAVIHFEPDGEQAVATVVGPLAPVFVGECLEIDGTWETDRRWGRQFRARGSVPADPASAEGARRYLASGIVPGIGPELARRLVARFGEDTMRVLDEEPNRLRQVRGIGAKRLAQIKDAWQEKSAERQTRIFLQGHGIGAALAQRILHAWGPETVQRVKREPYQLIRDIPGVGFRTADGLALRLGVGAEAPQRIAAGILHALATAAGAGHCYLPDAELMQATGKLLQLEDDAAIGEVLAALRHDGRLVVEAGAPDENSDRIWYAPMHEAECRVSDRLAALVRAGGAHPDRIEAALEVVERRLHIDLAPEQRRAVQSAFEQALMVVTGGPGTGKTTLVRAIVGCAERLDLDVALAAPTGRAAKRLEQATSHPAKTLHRLLEYRFDTGFGRDEDNPLEADLVVVDEMSMVDLNLMDALMSALRPDARLLLVGDSDQLPPVGPGAILRDLTESSDLPVLRLQTVFRQAQASEIVVNAHRINAGELPLSDPAGDAATDFYMIEPTDSEHAADLVRRVVTQRLPRRFGLDASHDVQVLAPMHRGKVGVAALNAMLQDALNPGTEPARPESPSLRAGDRVMQLRNDYDREVFNGDIGHVYARTEDELTVDFEGRLVGYSREDTRDLALAYASTVHKSQGSEYAGVVVVLMEEHHIMLQRNLLYTALTRARDVAVLISTRKALGRAVRNASPAVRYTALRERLAEEIRR